MIFFVLVLILLLICCSSCYGHVARPVVDHATCPVVSHTAQPTVDYVARHALSHALPDGFCPLVPLKLYRSLLDLSLYCPTRSAAVASPTQGLIWFSGVWASSS
jgi:hypothetical protein